MKEPLKDAFFQPANHPYFVKEKPFWTIDRGSVPKPQQFEASSQPADPSNLIFRCESSRVASVSLSLPSAVSSTWQFLPAPDASHRGRPDGVESDNGASLEADDTASQTGRGNIEPGVIINASTCPSLCRHASFLTDSLNRKNLLGGYFDADNDLDERVSSVREAAAGLSQRRRPRKRCRGAHHEGSDRLPHSTEVDRDNGALSDENEGPKVSDSGRGTRDSSMPDSCSVCSGSSDGSGHIGDVIQPMALKLHLAEEVREDVTKLASSLTRRLFFARQKHEDVSATGSGPTLYHRDSDRSHLNVNTGVGASDCLQTAAASSRNSVGARARAEPDGSTARVRTRSRHAGRGTAHRRRSFEHTFSDVIAQDAGTDRSADCTAPWTTSSSRGNANTHGIYSQFISSSGSSVFASTVEQFGIDETATQRESRDRKRLRRQRRCCRAAVIVASLALLAAVIATVGVLYTVGWLSPAALSTSDSTGNTVVGTSAVTSTMTTARLSSSSTSESVIITFVGALRLMMDFSPEMSDINSSVSRNLSRLFCNAVDRIYHNNSESLSYDPLNGCLVTNFTHGSIKINFRVMFAATLPEKRENGSSSSDTARSIVNKLRAYVRGYNSDGLQWDKDFFEMYEEEGPATSTFHDASHKTTVEEVVSSELSAVSWPTSLVDEEQGIVSSTDAVPGSIIYSSSQPFQVSTMADVQSSFSPEETWSSLASTMQSSHRARTTETDNEQTSLTNASVESSSGSVTTPATPSVSFPLTTPSSLSSNSRIWDVTTAITATTTVNGPRSPCYSLTNTTGIRLAADPLNCRAYYVCGSGASILVHMNCTFHSYYSYYDPVKKSCEFCDAAKCSQCAGLKPPLPKAVLPLSLLLFRPSTALLRPSTPSLTLIATKAAKEVSSREQLPPEAIIESSASDGSLLPEDSSLSPDHLAYLTKVHKDTVTSDARHLLGLGISTQSLSEVTMVTLATSVGSSPAFVNEPYDNSAAPLFTSGPLQSALSSSGAIHGLSPKQISASPKEYLIQNPIEGSSILGEDDAAAAAQVHVAAEHEPGGAVTGQPDERLLVGRPHEAQAAFTTWPDKAFLSLPQVMADGASSQPYPSLAPMADAASKTSSLSDTKSSSVAVARLNRQQVDTSTVRKLCEAIDLLGSPVGEIIADPQDCTRFAYCFRSKAVVQWQCDCGQMFAAHAKACRPCDESVCGTCQPCSDIAGRGSPLI